MIATLYDRAATDKERGNSPGHRLQWDAYMDNDKIKTDFINFLNRCLAAQETVILLLSDEAGELEKLRIWTSFKHEITGISPKKASEFLTHPLLRKFRRLTDRLLDLLRRSSHEYKALLREHHKLSSHDSPSHSDPAYQEWHRALLDSVIAEESRISQQLDSRCSSIRLLAGCLWITWEKEFGSGEVEGYETTKGLIGWLKKVDRKEWIEGIMP